MERSREPGTVPAEDLAPVVVGVVGLVDMAKPNVPEGDDPDGFSSVHLFLAPDPAGLLEQIQRRSDQEPDEEKPEQDLVEEQSPTVSNCRPSHWGTRSEELAGSLRGRPGPYLPLLQGSRSGLA